MIRTVVLACTFLLAAPSLALGAVNGGAAVPERPFHRDRQGPAHRVCASRCPSPIAPSSRPTAPTSTS